MREVVIVSTARAPMAKAFSGAFNHTKAPTLGAHVIRAAISRAGLDNDEVQDVIMGNLMQIGTHGWNLARVSAMTAGLSSSVCGMTVDRQCASGLLAVSIGANQIMQDGMDIVIGAGVECITQAQWPYMKALESAMDENTIRAKPAAYMPMLQTAENLAAIYGISRDRMDEYALRSQRLTAQAQEAGRFDEEIIPIRTTKMLKNKETGEITYEEVLLTKDEGNRPETTFEQLRGLKTAVEGGTVTAGNASQFADGASANVLMEAKHAERKGLEPLGYFRGMSVLGCEPDVMGMGPVYAVPHLLKRHNLTIDDIGIWELNEAFAVQVLCCIDQLGLPVDRVNVNGGAISVGHPYGVSGARLVGHALIEAKRRSEKYAVVTMCVGGGMGVAALLEVI